MNPILSIKELTISFSLFNQTYKVLNEVNFSLIKGESVAIVGESGSGKTTLAKAIMGLNSQHSTIIEQGEIQYFGQDLLKLSEKELRKYRGKEISMVFQDPLSALNPTMKVGDQVLETLLKHNPKMSKESGKKRVLQLFSWVGIQNPEERYYFYPHQFSGGMRQRVVIAIALSTNPKLLIADEPTSALDVNLQMQILNLLKKIEHELQTTIILITHDLNFVSKFAAKTIVMYAGQVVEYGKTQEIFSNPKHPYTQKLLKSIPKLNLQRNDRLIPIHGSPPSILHPVSGCPFHPRCEKAQDICKKANPTKTMCWLHD